MTQQQQQWQKEIKWDADGLVPTVVQDALSKEVLMLAYMNEESLQKSLESGQTWFWSRSRGELWNKGATSGHTQQIESLHYDCDGDTLLVKVRQNGPACHTGAYSCFYREGTAHASEAAAQQDDRFGPLSRLEATIAQRDAERPEGAYTTYLFEKGVDKILKKVGEETAEVIIAAKNRDGDELRCESADLIFHLMVLLREQGIPFDDVLKELEFRHRKPVKKD
ncbi:bifunctional phosphoribosyl-AMP cyclohydrolase/phosphoribosyl-ATP diphosphatase HisIE [Cohnella sp. LGH]|uniref:bifunctional phosphoribosyl-AMP cyclohydrolase/phosphoribosyl-ATP diphosphatase HisIE n=1 Tax=Cohnella sp. LGH TaxID=1619153 RepID=UPI001ADBF52C|nr:bifunctional phosphoribosyl-AMP cyclohydrolase/phosphoribosyl-ATP diphosphatase HisIE [Cohnella sp. LGH]QTH42106.1 bifunctional phosphoribosyl-AMP cyclohydrolase/phosphoribosyl-ATP diphosphatase HisIE [Cohnella sp. LGH]